MKKTIFIGLLATFIAVSFPSCRENKEEPMTEEEVLIEEMQEEGADVKVIEDGDETKIKMETEDTKVKIKEDEDGDSKVKVKKEN